VYSPETLSFPFEGRIQVNSLFMFIIIVKVYCFISSYSRLGTPGSTLYTVAFSLVKKSSEASLNNYESLGPSTDLLPPLKIEGKYLLTLRL